MRAIGSLCVVVGFILGAVLFVPVFSAAPPKKEAASKPKVASADGPKELDGLGKLGSAIKGEEGVYEYTATSRDEKGRPKQEKVRLEIPADLEIHLDQKVRIEDLPVNETIYILGREATFDVRGGSSGVGLGGSSGGKDRRIQNGQVILYGDPIEVNESYVDAKDATIGWCKADVTRSNSGLWVQYKNDTYRVMTEPSAPILKRAKCDRKLLKSGVTAIVKAERAKSDGASDDESGKKAAAQKPKFNCKQIIIIDPRLVGTAYAGILTPAQGGPPEAKPAPSRKDPAKKGSAK